MIRTATLDDAPALAEVLADAVDGGASVNFMAGFTLSDARAYYDRWLRDPGRLVLAAGDGRIDGTAQLILETPPNQPHRAELAKMLVHRRARGSGLGRALFDAICVEATKRGRTLLTFDTVTGSVAERMYLSCGCTKVGEIPGYALMPDGRPAGTSVFFKQL